MSQYFFDPLNHTLHHEFIAGPVQHLDWNMKDCRMEFTYRDGTTRTVTDLPEMRFHRDIVLSCDGRYLVIFCQDEISIRCFNMEPFSLRWEKADPEHSFLYATIPADDGVIIGHVLYPRKYMHLTDDDGHEVFDEVRCREQYLFKLSYDDGSVIQRYNLDENFNGMGPEELTHDYLQLNRIDKDGNVCMDIIRKRDLTPVASLKFSVHSRLRPHRFYIYENRLYVRVPADVPERRKTSWIDLPVDVTLPDEVLESAARYSEETENYRRLLFRSFSNDWQTDSLANRIYNSDGTVKDTELYDSFAHLFLPSRFPGICAVCGSESENGMTAIGCDRFLCAGCWQKHQHNLPLFTNVCYDIEDRFEREASHVRQSLPGAPVSPDFMAQYEAPACVQMRLELTRRGRTESWIFIESQIRHSLEKYKKDADSLKLTMFPELFGEDPDYGSMAEMIYENGQENWTIYPPIENAGAYGFELLHRTLPAFDAAEKDHYASNPFTRDFTEFEVLSFDNISEIPEYLNLFARAVHACGWNSVYTTSKFIASDTFDYVYRSTASADGMNLHDFLRVRYAFHTPVIAIAEDLGAMIRTEGFYFLVGGTPEFMRQFRKHYNSDGCPFIGMTSKFVPGLDFSPAFTAVFKRRLTAWVTASEKYPLGLYDILHAHHFSKNNRQFIRDDNHCGCFHCGRIFPGREITQWTDRGTTAFCPHCGVDSLLPENCGHPVTDKFLTKMHEYWFGPK